MSLWKPEPPQGNTPEQGLAIIGRPMIPIFGPPQGIGGEVIPPIGGDALVQTLTVSALVQTGTLSALVQGEI